jgi:tetratricopeptide (TPR) repeat protein
MKKILELAKQMHQNGKFIEAIDEYLIALEKDNNSIYILTQLAFLSYEVSNFAKVLEYCNKAIELNCDSHLIWFTKGSALLKLNKIDIALNCFDKVIKLCPDFYPARVNIFSALLKNANTQHEISTVVEASNLCLKLFIESDQLIKVIDNKFKVPLYRLKHDLEQAKYLAKVNLNSNISNLIIKQLSGILGNQSRVQGGVVYLSNQEYSNLKSYFKEIIIFENIIFSNYLNPALDWGNIEKEYLNNHEIIFIDNFLSVDVLEWLVKFSLLSKVWLREYDSCYLGAFANNGFMSEIHLNIARELRIKLPKIIGGLDLDQLWGFKYDSQLGAGINVHADFAEINLNFWITPDNYNLDPTSGGMKVYSHPAPSSWTPSEYNAQPDMIYDYLRINKSECITIPYKQNRAVLFNSALFHETDKINFVDEYQGRRINITYLFGKQLKY